MRESERKNNKDERELLRVERRQCNLKKMIVCHVVKKKVLKKKRVMREGERKK